MGVCEADAACGPDRLARTPGAIVETASTLHTLLDEWQWRREVLSRNHGDDTQLVNAQLRVLDYLIGRYHDSPAAHRPAPPRPQPDFQVNHRAIVVLHHIWKGRVGGIKTPQEAKNRMAAILARMRSRASVDQSEECSGAISDGDDSHNDAAISPVVWSSISARTCRGRPPRNAKIAAALVKNPCIPHAVTLNLYERIVAPGIDDVEAAKLLVAGRNRIALIYVVYAWQELSASGQRSQAWQVLNEFLATPQPTATVIQSVRESLAHENAQVRLAAQRVLALIGVLEDIGLINDLLALPVAADEHPAERNALLRAMWAIAKAGRVGKGNRPVDEMRKAAALGIATEQPDG
jgi:hypothetical protein